MLGSEAVFQLQQPDFRRTFGIVAGGFKTEITVIPACVPDQTGWCTKSRPGS